MNQDLIFQLAAKTAGEQYLTNFANKLKDVDKSAKEMAKTMNEAKTLAKELVVGFGIEKGLEFGKNILEIADHLHDMSQKTGISADALSGFQEAAKEAGLSTEGLETGLRKFSVSLNEARQGNAGATAAFKNLGIGVDELKSKSPELLLKHLADNFVGLKDGPEKAANAVKLFGKSGADMIPFLNQGADALSAFSLGLSEDFVDRAHEFNKGVSQLGTSFTRDFAKGMKEVLPTLQEILTAFKKYPSLGLDIQSTFRGIAEGIRLLTIGVSAFAEETIDFFDDLIKAGRQTKEALAFGNRDLHDANIKKLEDEYQKRHESRQKSQFALEQKLLKHDYIFGDGDYEAIANETKAPPGRKGGKDVSGEGINAGERDRVKEFLLLKQQENDQLKESLDDYKLSAVELDKVKAARKLDNEELKAAKGLNADQTAKLKEGVEAIKEQRQALIDLEYQQQRTFSYGAQKAFQDYTEAATNSAKQAQQLFTKMFQSMEDALTDFVKTGTLNFSKFADAVIDELIRITIRQRVIAPIVGAIGGSLFGASQSTWDSAAANVNMAANGGIMTGRGMAKLNRYANGGVATSPQLAVFGEGSTPEAFVPLPDGRSIPVNMKGSAGGVMVNVTVNADGSTSASGPEAGKQLGTVIANAIKLELIKQKRPGGLLAG